MSRPPIKSSNITATEAQPAGASSIDRPDEKSAGETAKSVPELLTIQECTEIANIGRTSLYNLAAQGAFPIVKIGSSSRVPRQRFLDFLHDLPTAKLRVPRRTSQRTERRFRRRQLPSALPSEPNADSDEGR